MLVVAAQRKGGQGLGRLCDSYDMNEVPVSGGDVSWVVPVFAVVVLMALLVGGYWLWTRRAARRRPDGHNGPLS